MASWDDHPYSARQLQYILAVAELGGFRKAAEACGVSQPSLSAQVAQVEEALGVQIFERHSRGVRLTTAGASLVERARHVLLAMQDLRETARQHGDPLRGTLRIGVIPTVCPYLLPEVAPEMQRHLPGLRVLWSEDKTHSLVRQIEDGALDAAIFADDHRLAELERERIGDDPFMLAAAPGTSADGRRLTRVRGNARRRHGIPARGRSLFPRSCAGAVQEPWRQRSRTARDRPFDARADGGGRKRRDPVASDGGPVENRRGQLAVRAFSSPTPTRAIVLAWRKGSALKRPLHAVADVLRAAWPTPSV